MSIKSPLRGGLFIFECFRFTFLMGIMAALKAGAEANFPWLVYAVPNALFLLMTLFLWLNFDKYRVYAPLYISGKALSFFSVLGWFFFARQTGTEFLGKASDLFSGSLFLILFFGDLITIFLAILITTEAKKNVGEQSGQGGEP